MESRPRINAIRKLAAAGEQAGLSLDQMIQLLNSGMTVVALLDLITWRLDFRNLPHAEGYQVWGHSTRKSGEVAQ
jgi:hypothetical protein